MWRETGGYGRELELQRSRVIMNTVNDMHLRFVPPLSASSALDAVCSNPQPLGINCLQFLCDERSAFRDRAILTSSFFRLK